MVAENLSQLKYQNYGIEMQERIFKLPASFFFFNRDTFWNCGSIQTVLKYPKDNLRNARRR